MGYRHIDTAQAYENEKGTGDGVRACGVKREDLDNILSSCTVNPMINQALATSAIPPCID